MSGGHFSYKQHVIDDIADEMTRLIEGPKSANEYDYGLSEPVRKEMMKAVILLRKAAIYAQRVDWLISGDDSEETFHKLLKVDIEQLEKELSWMSLKT